MPFQPGQSGNPSGRPKSKMADGRSLSDVAKEHTEAAIKVLVAIVRNKRASASARVQQPQPYWTGDGGGLTRPRLR